MSRIQSSTGLITGIPIEETVNKLMAIATRPRDLLDDRTKSLKAEQLAVNKLSSLTLAFQFEVNRLGNANLFQAKAVKSSDSDVLEAALQAGANPAVGSYKIRALQTASSQQLVSNSFSGVDDLSADGTLSFGFGGFVDTGVSLSDLNGGNGVSAGKIRITDRAGNSADVDLRVAHTVDDVLRAINNNADIEVTAEISGDQFRLVDTSGGSGNLRVQEVRNGTTAADLGLATINVAANSADGLDVFALSADTKLSLLNDGNGVQLRAGNDLAITLADGTTLNVDLGTAEDLGDVLSALNAANPTKLTASIAPDGNRLRLTDLTVGGSTFAVANVGNGSAATDLRLTTTAIGSTITGGRIVSGLRDTLVSSLRGGQGLGTLGDVTITNRNNITSTVHLAGTETLSGVIAAINSQATGVKASINSSRNGILLTDTTGATLSNLIVADGDAHDSATALGIVKSVAATAINSGTLARQQVSRATLLSSLNRGAGVSLNDFRVTDSEGLTATVDMNTLGSEAKTVGDVIDRINALAVDVEARINDSGDGILLVDLAGGTGGLKVAESGSGHAAADLHLLGTGKTVEIDGQPATVIDGSSRSVIDLSDLDEPGANVLLSSLNGGQGIDFGAFRITDSNGGSDVVVLNPTAGSFNSVADVIDAINATDIGVEARLDASKTGILLFDTAGGASKLKVEEIAEGTTAADLGLTKPVKTITVDSQQVQAIDGAGVFAQPADASALASLVSRINSLSAGVTASTIFDGDSYRLSLTVNETGAGNDLLVDGLAADLEFEEFSFGQDAAIELGGTTLGSGIVVTSDTNTFEDAISGVSLTIVEPSEKTISVDVSATNTNLLDVAQDFVDAYNSLRSNLDEVTDFDSEALTTGILFGTQAALRVDSDLNHVLTGRFFGTGKFESLEAVGIGIGKDGKLSLNKSKFEAAFADDPGALTKFFTDETLGVSAKLNNAIERLVGETDSTLSSRSKTLATQIERNNDRITLMDESLAKQRDRLFNQFSLLESTVATLQQNLAALQSLQIIPPLSVNRNR
jgi:flagellar hook-associated protein 2